MLHYHLQGDRCALGREKLCRLFLGIKRKRWESRNQLWPGTGSSERRGAGKIQSLFSRESLCFINKLLTIEKISTERREAQILGIVESLPPKPTSRSTIYVPLMKTEFGDFFCDL